MTDQFVEAVEAVAESFDEAHHFWHECVNTYHDPAKFRTNLNALIQASRNVTFRIQSHKKAVPGFEEWYGNWQAFLKADPLMKWAHDARTQVTKKRGLAANSRARARAIWSYGPAAQMAEHDVAADTPTPALVAAIVANVPGDLGDHVLVEVTREWQLDELPGKEVLRAMLEVLRVLSAMISDLHRLFHGQALPPLLAVQRELPLSCVEELDATTTIRVNPRTGAIYTAGAEEFRMTPELEQSALDRYGPPNVLGAEDLGRDPQDPAAFCESLLELGKQVLARDKHHIPILFFRDASGWIPHTFTIEDKLDKFVIWHRMADEVRRNKYDCFVLVTESWLAEPSHVLKDGKVPESFANTKGRREALTVQYETSSGDRGLWAVMFHRRFGKVVFDETTFTEPSSVGGFPEPIRAAWREMAADAGAESAEASEN